MTYRQTISDVRSMNKLLSSDGIVNDRAILSEVVTAANLIVGQSFDRRKYWQSPNMFTPLPCIEMEEVPLSECCEYTNECNIAKSKITLPKIGEGTLGLAIQGIFSLDGRKKLKETNPNRYANILKLGIKPDIYYWILNDHLYVTNPETKAVIGYFYFTAPVDSSLLYPTGCDCKNPPSIELQCQNPLDQTFHFPETRMFDLKQLVYKNLLTTYFSISQDTNSDNKDDSIRR